MRNKIDMRILMLKVNHVVGSWCTSQQQVSVSLGCVAPEYMIHSVIFKSCSSDTLVLRHPHMFVDIGTHLTWYLSYVFNIWLYSLDGLCGTRVCDPQRYLQTMFKCHIGVTPSTHDGGYRYTLDVISFFVFLIHSWLDGLLVHLTIACFMFLWAAWYTVIIRSTALSSKHVQVPHWCYVIHTCWWILVYIWRDITSSVLTHFDGLWYTWRACFLFHWLAWSGNP